MPAYNQFYPQNYQYPYYQQYQPQMTQQPLQAAQPAQTQMQSGGFVSVPSEEVIRTYPVAPGNCVTFKIEGQPIVIEKSMGFSQLESPRFERYRLVKEEYAAQTTQNAPESISNLAGAPIPEYALKSDMDVLRGLVDDLRISVEAMAKTKSSTKAKKETEDEG